VGDRLTEEEQSKRTEPKSYGDIFDELFPEYLLMGMTPEQYWDGESSLKPAYRKAYRIRMENEQRLADRNNWYMGQYIIAALQAVPLLVGGLNTKGARIPEYPKEPFLEKFEKQKTEEARKKKEEDQMKMAMAMFHAFTMQANKRIESKKPDSAGQ